MADLRIVDAPVLLQESITDDVKMPTGGLGNYAIRLGDLVWYVVTKEQLASKGYVDTSSQNVQNNLDTHIADKANPHQVTKEQVGLGNVDNTADIDKPVSNAVSSAIITATTDMATKAYVNQKDNLKADKATTLSGYGITDAYTKDETYNQSEISNSLSLKADVAYVDSKSGDLVTLTTTDKTNLVKAINEVYNNTRGVVALYRKNVDVGAGENGWTALLIQDASGLTQQQINDYNHVKSPEIFGAKGMTINDQAVFTNLSANHVYALAREYTVPVWRSPAKTIIGNNTKINVDSVNGDTTVAVQIPDNANYSNIDFVNNPLQKKPWSYAVIGNNSTLNNVGFYNFDDPNTVKNSWGVYLENKSNITFNSPKFGGNGLSDIAIVDNVKNITINNAINTVNADGVFLDIEPNNDGNIENINVLGGKYSHIAVLENSYQTNGIKGLNITGATVKLLELRGGQVKVSNSKIERVKGNWANTVDYAGYQNEYFGKLEIDNVNLSKNLIADDKVLSFSGYEPSSFWSLYAPDVVDTKTIYDSNGFYTALNSNKQSVEQSLTTRNFIDLPSGTTQVATMIGYSVDNATDSAMFEPVLLSFYDSSNNLIGKEVSIKGGRTAKGTKYVWSNEVNVYDVPSGATKFKISVRSNKKGSTLNIRKIGVHALSMTDGNGNFNAIMQSYAQPNLTKNIKAQQTLSYSIDANAVKYTEKVVPGAKVGDMVQISTTSPMGATSRIWAEISGDNTLSIYHQNLTATVLAINTMANFTIQ